MTRGKQKIEAQKRNEKNQKPKGSQLEARAVALKVICPICKVLLSLESFVFGCFMIWFDSSVLYLPFNLDCYVLNLLNNESNWKSHIWRRNSLFSYLISFLGYHSLFCCCVGLNWWETCSGLINLGFSFALSQGLDQFAGLFLMGFGRTGSRTCHLYWSPWVCRFDVVLGGSFFAWNAVHYVFIGSWLVELCFKA